MDESLINLSLNFLEKVNVLLAVFMQHLSLSLTSQVFEQIKISN